VFFYACTLEGERDNFFLRCSFKHKNFSSFLFYSNEFLLLIWFFQFISENGQLIFDHACTRETFFYPGLLKLNLTKLFSINLISGPLSEVQTATGLDVTLPCDLFPSTLSSSPLASSHDKVTLVIWYKEGNQKPIYSWVESTLFLSAKNDNCLSSKQPRRASICDSHDNKKAFCYEGFQGWGIIGNF
jgi:hypothetical protein